MSKGLLSNTRNRAFLALAVSFVALLPNVPYLWIFAFVPFTALCILGLKTSMKSGFLLLAVWCPYLMLLYSPFFFIIGRFYLICIYSPIFIMFWKAPENKAGFLYLAAHTILWDYPLLLWMYVGSFLEIRCLGPFYSEIDEIVSVGSLPMNADVKYLKTKNVGAVVNMCRESEGPVAEYKAYGIQQCRLPTPDLSEPDISDVVIGVKFMHEFKTKNPGKRIFIHCKGPYMISNRNSSSFMIDGFYYSIQSVNAFFSATIYSIQ